MPQFERLLAPVPPATHAQPGIANGQKWSSEYNVACWARGRSSEPSTVSLLVRFRDGSGERELRVDRTVCRQEASLLLSGRISVQASGRIEEMTVWLVSEPACELFVDELYCQRAGANGAAASRPILAAR